MEGQNVTNCDCIRALWRNVARLAPAMGLLLCLSCGNQTATQTVKIGIISIIEHPFLEQARQGFIDTMAELGFKEGEKVKYDYRNAYGKIENASTIAAAFVGRPVDLIFGIATPTTQAVKEKTSTIPIVFAAVTDPLAAGLVDSLEKPGHNVTGISDMIPVRYQLDVIRQVLPAASKLGIPYNAGEANSVSLVGKMNEVAPEIGFTIVEANASTTADVAQAVSSLVGKVDAIYMPTDNTMAAAVNVISDICMKNKIPFFSSENETIKKDGALAALSVDHYKLGAEAAKMAVQILKDGRNPGDIPVTHLNRYDLELNMRVAAALGIKIPDEVKAKASLIQ